MHTQIKTIVVFGSSKPAEASPAYQCAYGLGHALGEAGYRVANGGYGGTMQASSAGAQAAGAPTVGVTCTAFGRSGPNPYLDEIISTDTLYERLAGLIELGDAYIVLPGGTGTLVELALAWELIAKKFLAPMPVICWNDYWRPVVDMLVASGEVKRNPVLFAADVPSCLALLQEHFNSSLSVEAKS